MKLVYPNKVNNTNTNELESNIISIQLFDKKQEYDALIKIVGTLFIQCKHKLNESNFKRNEDYMNNKNIINQFEKVMSCIRFEVSDKKDIFKDNKDNLNLLMDLSESINIVSEFKKLLDAYLKIMDIDNIQIQIDESEVNINNNAKRFRGDANESTETRNNRILPIKIIELF